MKRITKKIVAIGASVMMMGSLALNASAADLNVELTTQNRVTYMRTFKANNKSFDTYIGTNKSHNVPGYPASFSIKSDKTTNYVTLCKKDNIENLKLTTQIELYNKNTKVRSIQANSSIVTQNAGCGVGYPRKSASTSYQYTLTAIVTDPKGDALSSRVLDAIINQ